MTHVQQQLQPYDAPEQRFCSACGEGMELDGGVWYCPYCGYKEDDEIDNN